MVPLDYLINGVSAAATVESCKMLVLQVAVGLLGLATASPLEAEKRSVIGPRPVLGWIYLPAAIWCYKANDYDTNAVHRAATSRPYGCTSKDGFEYCKYALLPVKPMFESYIVGRIKPGQQKMEFSTAETIETVWDDDGEGQHAKRPNVSSPDLEGSH